MVNTLPPPRPPCPATVACYVCYAITHPQSGVEDKTQIHPIDVFRRWELLGEGASSSLHKPTVWRMVAPLLGSKGYTLDNTSLISAEAEEEEEYQRLIKFDPLLQPAKDQHGHPVFVKCLAGISRVFPELQIWQSLLSSKEAAEDPHNHTLPPIASITCRVDTMFPNSGRPHDFRDWRELVITPKLRPLTKSTDDPFLPPDIGSCMDFFQQILEGIEYMHTRKVAHGDISVYNILTSRSTRRPGAVRYFFANFGCASLHNIAQQPPIIVARKRLNNAGPEHSMRVPYNPFPNDIYAAGLLIKGCVRRSSALEDCERCWDRIPLITELVSSMLAQNPDDRPTAQVALRSMTDIHQSLPEAVLNIALQPLYYVF